MASATRHDPDELLRTVQVEDRKKNRGRLTVFFGAAPGVGKTFAMLQEAALLLEVERRDVVAGVVETHGRFETTTLLAGFERLPRRKVAISGAKVEELDLDAALARRPSLVLIDELAHTNAPGSRHAKRWQDVEELLDAGIEVYTTLDVHHVESLNDVVAQITGVVVRETVPDAVLDTADDIKLIDLPPDDLLERLREGKVHVPAQGERALENFFQKGNLLALRELALRKTAERVDAEIQEWRRAHGIEKTWAATDRLLVCIGASPYSSNLLRAGRRMAVALRAQWFAVNVETPRTLRLAAVDRARVSQNLRLAEELGAETITLTGERPADEILRFARERNVTKIVVGKPRRLRLRDRFGTSFIDELLLGSGDIDIYATVGEADTAAPQPVTKPTSQSQPVAAYATAVLAVVLATLLAFGLFGRSELADVVMVYLLGIVVVATRAGFRASVLCGVLSVLAFNFFFTRPYYTFAVFDLRHIVTFVVMLLVGVVVATLTQRVRDQVEVAQRSERRTRLLYAMSRELSRTEGMAPLIRVGARHLEQVFDANVAVFGLENAQKLRVDYATDGFATPVDSESGVVLWVLGQRRQAGAGTDTLASSRGFYVPLVSPGADASVLGVVGIYPERPAAFEDLEQRRLADAFVTLLATALERARLGEETERARMQIEAEQLRNTLLSSVSHDLRTPLAVMRGAASTLLDDDQKLDIGTRRELASALFEETERMDRQVRNLLDMTRLESGSVRIHKEWLSVQEVIGAAWSRVEPRLGRRNVTIHVPADLDASFDGVLIEQVVVNLLENAAKYTPDGSPIEVSAEGTEQDVKVVVSDRGPGVPLDEQERIFDKFHRGPSERTRGGVGLGLTICRAIVGAHGGQIWVENHAGGGASFTFTLPRHAPSAPEERLPEIMEKP